MLGRIKTAPVGCEIASVAEARDPPFHIEKRVGNLAGDHIHFVRTSDRDQHIRFMRAGALEHARMSRVSDDAAHVVAFVDTTNLFRRLIDNGYVKAFGCQVTSNRRAYLPCATDDHPHYILLLGSARQERLPFELVDARRSSSF